MITFKEFMSMKKVSLPPKKVALRDYDAVKKLNTKPKGNWVKNMTKKGPDPSNPIMPPVLKPGGSNTLQRAALKTVPKTPAEFMPRDSGHAPTTREKGIRLASL